jgi:hypothetical protein
MRKKRPAVNPVILILIGAAIYLSLILSAGNALVSAKQGSAQGMPGWQQVNTNGFSDPQTGEVTALGAFNGYLYAGTHNPVDPEPLYDGAQIFRSSDGVTWNSVTQPGFGNSHDNAPPAILDFIVFNNYLYAGTGRGNASQIWRSQNGTIWAPMDVTGFSNPDNVDVSALAVFDNMIYAGVMNRVTGVQIWRSYTGDNNSWVQQVTPANPGTSASAVTGFAEFDGALYAAIESDAPLQIWQCLGSDWTAVMSDGFGKNSTIFSGGMVAFAGHLYAGAGDTQEGAQLYRTQDGTTWAPVITPGFGDPNNKKVEVVFVFQNRLFVSVKNAFTGIEVWSSSNGTSWERANQDGFGDSHNTGSNQSNSVENFLGDFYVGTVNVLDGGEVWRLQQQKTFLYLPLTLRQ